MEKTLHLHCAVCGAENGCFICNPTCHENHATIDTMNIKCDNPNCPVVTIRKGEYMIDIEEKIKKLEDKVSNLEKENIELKTRVKILEKYELLVSTIKEMISIAQSDVNLATLKTQYYNVCEEVDKEIREIRAKRKLESDVVKE